MHGLRRRCAARSGEESQAVLAGLLRCFVVCHHDTVGGPAMMQIRGDSSRSGALILPALAIVPDHSLRLFSTALESRGSFGGLAFAPSFAHRTDVECMRH